MSVHVRYTSTNRRTNYFTFVHLKSYAGRQKRIPGWCRAGRVVFLGRTGRVVFLGRAGRVVFLGRVGRVVLLGRAGWVLFL